MRNVKLALYFVCRAAGLFRLAAWLTRDCLKILCYHGFSLADEVEFRPKLFIRPEVFEQRLDTIRRRRMNVLPLDKAVDQLYSGSLDVNSLAITVDDGFRSFHRLAVPKLVRHGFPATVYVTSYHVQNPSPIYRLVIQYMFWKTRRHGIDLKDVKWSIDRRINLLEPTERDAAMWACIHYGETQCSEAERGEINAYMGHLLNVPYDEILASCQFHLMTPDDLRSLAAADVDVQLHTHRHYFPEHDRARAEQEIIDNRAALSQWLVIDAKHFCYPSGLWRKHQWDWLDELSVKSSTTCLPGLNSAATARHALCRFLDGENIHQLEFEAALCGFPDLMRELYRKISAACHWQMPSKCSAAMKRFEKDRG